MTEEMILGFSQGVRLADGETMMPAGLTVGEKGPCSAVVELRQGVYHQIKRMFGVYGAGVCELRRVAIGGLALDPNLGAGGFREITQEELKKITDVRLQSFQKNNTTVL